MSRLFVPRSLTLWTVWSLSVDQFEPIIGGKQEVTGQLIIISHNDVYITLGYAHPWTYVLAHG